MLGVFGCVPAFDAYFRKGFGVSTLGRKSLRKIARFNEDHAEAIETHRVPTLDFASGAETARRYTRAKVIDMIFFVEKVMCQADSVLRPARQWMTPSSGVGRRGLKIGVRQGR